MTIEETYTAGRFAALQPHVQESRDSREHVLFTELLTKYDWKGLPSGFTEEYASRLTGLLDKSKALADILNYTYALLLLKGKP